MSSLAKDGKIVFSEDTEVINLTSILEPNQDYNTITQNLAEAISFLKRKRDLMVNEHMRDEQTVEVSYEFKCFLNEGAYAVYSAVVKKYGGLDMAGTGPSGDTPPTLIDIVLPDGSSVKVPWGTVSLPAFDEDSSLEMNYDHEEHLFQIIGTVKNKYIPELEEIVTSIREELNLRSIYKGRAIYLEFDYDGEAKEPTFIDLSNIDVNKVVLSRIAQEGLAPIMMRIEKTKECINAGIDLKYGALMEGPYGTGKTLAAFYIAKKTIASKWTFIYLKDCKFLAHALRIGDQYIHGDTGVVVFSEDIDQALRGERDSDMQDILNTLDGGDTKCKPIISIFTTNHIEKIEPTFMRGKRIGGLISLGSLDEETAERFIQVMVPSAGSDISETEAKAAAKHLVGIVPAFASEIIDKSKVFMIERDSKIMNAEDIRKAAESYKRQMTYAEMKHTEDAHEKLKSALKIVGEHMTKTDIAVSDELFEYLNVVASTNYNPKKLTRIKKK